MKALYYCLHITLITKRTLIITAMYIGQTCLGYPLALFILHNIFVNSFLIVVLKFFTDEQKLFFFIDSVAKELLPSYFFKPS